MTTNDNKVVMLPIIPGMTFEEVIRLLLAQAGWGKAVVEVIEAGEDGCEVLLFRSGEIRARVAQEGLDRELDGHVLHAHVDADVGLVVLRTLVENDPEIVWS